MPKNFNARELLEVAIQIEVNGTEYYSRMAEKAKNEETKKIFNQLSLEEKQHITDFTNIREGLESDKIEIPEEFLSEEVNQYLHSFSDGQVFPNWRSADEVAKEIHSDLEAVMHAISFEKDSLIYFHEIFDLLPEEASDRKAIGELIRQEKIHIAQLYTFLKILKNN